MKRLLRDLSCWLAGAAFFADGIQSLALLVAALATFAVSLAHEVAT